MFQIIKVNFNEIQKINRFIEENCKPKTTEILIGSGFSELLNDRLINYKFFNRGNSLTTHKRVKSINFLRDLEHCKVKIPPWSFQEPKNKNWLIKDTKSFGGNRIYNLNQRKELTKSEYFQKKIEGEHLSIQFFCKNRSIKILFVCNQFFRKNKKNPFIIETLISKNVKPVTMKMISLLCKKICRLYFLNGINNLDIVLEEKSNSIFLIELNARPGLSTNMIYKSYPKIFDKPDFLKKQSKSNLIFATKIIYSEKDISITNKNFRFIKSLEKKNIFSELPTENEIIKKGNAICLLHLSSKKIHILREKLKKMSYKLISNLS